MNKKTQISALVVMIGLLGIFIVNLSSINDNNDNYVNIPGIYKATYNFKNDEINTVPEGWTITAESEGDSAMVIEEFNGHKKVVEFIDGKNDDWFTFNYNLPLKDRPTTNGFVEWWWATDDIETALHMYLRGSGDGSGRMTMVGMKDGEVLGVPVENNEWVHMRVDFECDTNTYNVYVNGVLKRENFSFYDGNVESFFHIRFYTSSIEKSVNYIDAVGFSWDPNYEVGDNLNLEKEINPDSDWGNNLLFGITIISFIVVFIVVLNPKVSLPFTVRFLVKREIIKNKKYIRIFNYIFLIFKKRLVVENKKWDAYEASKTSIEVIPELDRHTEVIEIYDNTDCGRGYIRNNIIPDQESGEIEWYWRTTDTSKRVWCSLINSDLYGMVSVRIENKNIYAWNGNKYQNLHEVSANQWYHMKVDFNCTMDSFDVYIDGVKKADQFDFRNPSTSAEFTEFYTDGSQYGYHVYLSDIKYSWDRGYEIGDNLQILMKLINKVYFYANFIRNDKLYTIHRWTRKIFKQGLKKCLNLLNLEWSDLLEKIIWKKKIIKGGISSKRDLEDN